MAVDLYASLDVFANLALGALAFLFGLCLAIRPIQTAALIPGVYPDTAPRHDVLLLRLIGASVILLVVVVAGVELWRSISHPLSISRAEMRELVQDANAYVSKETLIFHRD